MITSHNRVENFDANTDTTFTNYLGIIFVHFNVDLIAFKRHKKEQ